MAGERSGLHHSLSTLWAGAGLQDAGGRSRWGPQRGRCFCEGVPLGQGRSCAKETAVVLGQAPGQTQLSSVLFLLGA